jgi:type III restriction enzyme
MNKKFKCQSVARDSISLAIVEHLKDDPTTEVIGHFKGVTGCGKTYVTLMGAIKDVYNEMKNMGKKVAFIWMCPGIGDLDSQSKKSAEKNLIGSGITIRSLPELMIDNPSDLSGSLTVINWESTNRGFAGNIAMMEREIGNSFPEMCVKTKVLDIPIVFIVDESQSFFKTIKCQEVYKLIDPTYTLHVTATSLDGVDIVAKITQKQARDAGLIVKHVVGRTVSDWKDGLDKAITHQDKLVALAEEVGADYYPKIAIFLPDVDKNGDSVATDETLSYLKEKGFTEEKVDIVLWFANRKSKGLESSKENNNRARFFLTKQAIIKGTDIPSLKIGLILRSIKNEKTSEQVIGRFVRQPELKHYGNELDTAVIYGYPGFIEDIEWDDPTSIEGNIEIEITVRDCFAEDLHQFPKLMGAKAERADSFIDGDEDAFITGFYPLFMEKVQKHIKIDGVEVEGETFDTTTDKYTIELCSYTIDIEEQKSEKFESKDYLATENDVAIIYKRKMKEKLKHSFKHLSCIEDVIDEAFDLYGKSCRENRQVLILNNYKLTCRLITETIRECEQARSEKKVEEMLFHAPPNSYYFNGVPTDVYTNKNFLYNKYHADRANNKSSLEKDYQEWLDNHSNVFWWSHNYDKGEGSFSVVYTRIEDGTLGNFYPDFIIKLKDERIFIVDTKGDNDVNETAKKEALIKALKDTNVTGGIVKQRDGNYYLDAGNGEQSLDDVFQSVKQAVSNG